MLRLTRRTWLAWAGLAPLTGVLLQAASEGHTTRTGRFRAGYFPNVVLRTHENREVRFYDDLLKDRWVIINFMYTECPDGVCPFVTANLAQIQRMLGEHVGRDIFIYSITLSPEHDTPEVLKGYARQFGAGPGWSFLTGSPNDIERLRRKLGFVDPDPVVDADKSQHSGMIRYGNEALERWGMAPGQADPNFIVGQLRAMGALNARAHRESSRSRSELHATGER